MLARKLKESILTLSKQETELQKMKCEVLTISTEVASKYPALKPLFDKDYVSAIDFGNHVSVRYSWLVDLTPEQQKEFDALTIELNKK